MCLIVQFLFYISWEQRKLYDIAEKVTEKNVNTNITETFTNSAEFGIVSQRDYFDHDISNFDNLSGYYVVQNDDFVYNPRISTTAPVGPINRNKLGRKGVMSPLYTVFRVKNIDFTFLEWYFKSECWHGFMRFNGDSGARSDRFSIKDEIMFQMPLPYPDSYEQENIGELLSKFDNLITLHQRKQIKQNLGVLPEKCCTKITNSWEQRKFKESVEIERGGSPRPINDYITNEPNGLNWIKIGDAPEQGNVIVKTAEKIKPSGLSKTRQVQIGDLILSNSMSFGKPYIMGINGCIHDGWLLIRDVQGAFDLIFLCQLLGTDQMLKQYKARAAGSTVNNLNKELVGNTLITVPTKCEQHKLGGLFQKLDDLITLHQRKLKDFHGGFL